MNEKLKKYFAIELAGFPKAKRNQLHIEFLQNLENETFKFEDISNLLNEAEHKNIVIRQPFFEKIIYPILDREISQNNLQAIKHLVKLEQKLFQLQRRTKNNKPSKRQLILEGLQIYPDDKELLKMYELDLRNYLWFTIHEVPSGVLYSMDGANEIQCDELIGLLSDYEKVCKKLTFDREDLIDKCRFHFENYRSFLKRRKEFLGYEDYLKKQAETNLRKKS